MQTRTIFDFYSTDYLDYARYTVENRALPSILDGLKPGGRKILHAALETLSYDKSVKMLDLVGSTYSKSGFHHGNSSLESTIINLGSQYIDTFAPIIIDGTGGSLRSYASAAPRYLGVQLSKYAKLYEHDSEILQYNYDGEDKIEPKYYLPIIPMLLMKRDMGIALGYAYNNDLSIHPISLIDACIGRLSHKSTELLPYVHEYDGYWSKSDDGRYVSSGHCEYHADKIIVTSLSVNQTFGSFEKNLAKLLERGTIVKWENDSVKGKIRYIIHVNATKLQTIVTRNLQHRIFKTAEYIQKPTLYVLDEFKKVLHFKNHDAVIDYFVKFRLNKYDELRSFKIKAYEAKLKQLEMIRKFIDLYLNGTIIINNSVSQEDLEKTLSKHKIDASVLDIPIKQLTKARYEKLTADITELQTKIDYIKTTSKETLYMNDLLALKEQIKSDFPFQEFREKQA
jgi:DNA topoisomerase-2